MNCIEIDTGGNFISYFQNFILVFLINNTIDYLKSMDCLRDHKYEVSIFLSSSALPSKSNKKSQ